MVSGFLSCFELKLALAELRRATGSLEAVLLTLFHSRVTCQESCALQYRSVISVCLQGVLLQYRDGLLLPVLCNRRLLRLRLRRICLMFL